MDLRDSFGFLWQCFFIWRRICRGQNCIQIFNQILWKPGTEIVGVSGPVSLENEIGASTAGELYFKHQSNGTTKIH